MTLMISTIAFGIEFEIHQPKTIKNNNKYHLKNGGLNYVTSI